MQGFKKIRSGLAAATLLTGIGAFAVDFDYVISGYPPENPSRSVASVATFVLETGQLNTTTEGRSLDARSQTVSASAGILLNTTPIRGTVFTIR